MHSGTVHRTVLSRYIDVHSGTVHRTALSRYIDVHSGTAHETALHLCIDVHSGTTRRTALWCAFRDRPWWSVSVFAARRLCVTLEQIDHRQQG